MLADRLGVTLYQVGETDEDGDEPTRGERLQELRLAQRLVARDRRSLLLFDEMEDLLDGAFPGTLPGWARFQHPFRSRFRDGASKAFMHRLLEQAPAPTLWTMNDAREVSPAILRRMMFALELRRPPTRVRARVWARQLERHGIEAGADEALSLASEFDATPGVAAGATAAARLGGGDIATVRCGVRSLSRVLACERPPQGTPPRFDPGLVHADLDPIALGDRLAHSGQRRFSLCMQGPPGTGKSAYVRHLAERLGLEVMQKRASDLMSMWVGETEQRIAGAFAEARNTDVFLVFDEADSLARRRPAQRIAALAAFAIEARLTTATWSSSSSEPTLAELTDRRPRHWRTDESVFGLQQAGGQTRACLVSVSSEDLAELTSAAAALERTSFSEQAARLQDLSAKLRAALRPESLERLESDLEALVLAEGLAMRPGPRPQLDRGVLALLREAIVIRRVVEFRYFARTTGRRSRQRVEPYGLLYGNRAFVVARSDWSEEPRLWRLANVSEARLTDETFDRDPTFDLDRYARRSFGTFQEKPVEVTLRFDTAAARDASAFVFHPEQSVEEGADGSLTVRFTAGGIDEMCWHLFTWGESVTVVKPARLRRRLAEMCVSLAAHHQPPQR